MTQADWIMPQLSLLLLSAALAEGLPDPLDRFLAEPFEVLERDGVPRGFYPVVHSHLAEACVNLALDDPSVHAEGERCVARMVELALDPRSSPYDRPVDQVGRLGNHGLYLAHLGITLGAYARLVGDGQYDEVHGRIAHQLADLSLGDPFFNAPSFAGDAHRWPADQAVVLRALHLYDQARETQLHVAPLEAWVEVMERHRDPETGLYVSELTGADTSSPSPRGCALTWTVRYLAPVAPEVARDQWERAKDHHLQWLGPLAGFREWPRGMDGPADVDSGPIVMGVGAAATAFGLGAARAMDDDLTYAALVGTTCLGRGITLLDAQSKAVADAILATSIELAMRSWIPW